MEGTHYLKTGETKDFSAQQLMDCTWGAGNHACNGGDMYNTYEYMIEKQLPFAFLEDYPYTARSSRTCKEESFGKSKETISAYTMVVNEFDPSIDYDCDATWEALQIAPLSIGVDASDWNSYSGGTYDGPTEQSAH